MDTGVVTPSIVELCAKLAGSVPVGGMLVGRRFESSLGRQLWAAIDRRSEYHLLIELSEVDEPFEDGRSRGLTVSTIEYELPGETRRRFIDVHCLDTLGADALDLLARECLSALAEGASPADATKRALAKWRRFWGIGRSMPLSVPEQLGLFAELWFLETWLIQAIGADRAFPMWRGPRRARHDFESPGLSIEVKATGASGPCVHTINGLDQLSPPETGVLFLFSLRARTEGGATNSLPSIVRSCLRSAPDSLLADFAAKLKEARYDARDEAEYSETRIRVVEERLYSVDGSFPRLTAASFTPSVPDGVVHINYDIDVTGAVGSAVAENTGDAVSVLREAAQ